MPNDLPAWVAELTDPRRARTLDELADRLVPLAEHAIDVSQRLQTLLHDLNEPFGNEALRERADRLKARADEALAEISAEIVASGRERVERIHAACEERAEGDADRAKLLRDRADNEAGPLIVRQQRAVARQVETRANAALEEAVALMMDRVEELGAAVTEIIHQVLPLAREGLELAGRISELSRRVRTSRRGPVSAELAEEAAVTASAFDEAVGRLELEWSALGARGATVKAALRAAEEAAFSQVTAEMTTCVEELAAEHARVLGEAEARAMALLAE